MAAMAAAIGFARGCRPGSDVAGAGRPWRRTTVAVRWCLRKRHYCSGARLPIGLPIVPG